MAACFLRFPGRFPPSLLFRYLLSLISTVPVLLKLIKFMGPWPWKGTLLSQVWEFTGGTFSLLILTQALCIYLLLVKPSHFQPLFSDWLPELSSGYLLLILKLSCSQVHQTAWMLPSAYTCPEANTMEILWFWGFVLLIFLDHLYVIIDILGLKSVILLLFSICSL